MSAIVLGALPAQVRQPDQALARSLEAVALSEELGQPCSLALALHFAAVVRQYRREAAAVQQAAVAGTAVTTEHGLSFWHAGSLVMRGWALAKQGATGAGIPLLREGLSAWMATGGGSNRTFFLALLAEALAAEDRIEEGLDALAESLALIEKRGEGFYEAELHRLRGEFLLRRSRDADTEAEACFRRALAIAQRRQARSLELRATMSFTRLLQRQGRQAEARPMLAACYEWFSEGLDTPAARAQPAGRPTGHAADRALGRRRLVAAFDRAVSHAPRDHGFFVG